MAIVTYPLNGIMYNAENAETYLCTRTSGVYSADDNFSVQADGTMQVTVNPGLAWIKNGDFAGKSVVSTEPVILSFAMADGVLNRKDRIVLRFDVGENATNIVVKQGSPASTAEPKPIERTGTVYELGLYVVDIPAGTLGLSAANITSTMLDEEVCGIMRDGVTGIPTAQLQEQAEALMKQVAESVVQWEQEQTAEFEEWFEGIKGVLDGDTAGNLLNMIQQETTDRQAADSAIESKLGINATAVYEDSTVKITAPEGIVVVTFLAPSDCKAGDKYTLNGDSLTLTDLNGEPVEDAWKQGSPVTFTISGNKAFFKAGGGGKLPSDLAPLCPNFKVERNGTKVKISADKIQLNSYTNMVSGGVWAWGKTRPTKPTGENTKQWSRAELITTGKPYDGLYLGDVTPSDAVTETLIYLPENDGGSVKLVPFIVLSTDYLGGVYVMRQKGNKDWVGKYGNNVTYENSTADTWMTSYLNSVLDKSIADKVLECEIHVFEQGTIKRKCWIPSYGELYSDFTDSGNTFMPYFNSNGRRALIKQDDGNLLSYWTRTFYNLSNVRMINPDGSGYFQSASNKTAAYRPAFVLPKDFQIQQRPDGSYTVWNEQGLMTLGDIEASDTSIESIVHVTESGELSPFILLSQKYGDKNVSVLHREHLLPESWNSNYSGTTDYAASGIQTKFEEYAASTLDAPYRALLVSVEVTYKNLNPSDNWERKLSTKCCAIGAEELGIVSGWGLGNIFSYYESSENKKKKHDEGSYDQWYTRDIQSAFFSSNRAWDDRKPYFVDASGTTSGAPSIGHDLGLCPMLFFDPTAPIRLLADGTYDLVPEDPALATQTVSTLAEAGIPVQLKDIPVSTAGSAVTLKIPETADTYEEYLYGFKNYEDSNAGALVRKNIFDKENYSSTSSLFVNYGGSTLDTSLVDFANNNLDESVKKYLVEVQVQARGGPYPRSCFALSDDELGAPKVSPVYGTAFPYFSSNEARIAQYAGAASSYWGRDTSGVGTGSTGVMINESGVPTVIYAANALNGIRPTIAVSLDAWFVKNDDGTYTFAGDEPTPTEHPLEIEIDWPESDPLIARQWVYNEKGVYQTMLLGGIASTEDAPAYSPVLAENTWEQIAQACADHDPILDSWLVGDEIDVPVGSETLTFVIVGKDQDDLADGSGKAPLTFGMKNLMAETRKMNSSNTNAGSFAGSAMYSWLSGTIYPNLPTELKDAIKAVNKKTSSGGASSSIRTDPMYLWLFAEIEVFGSTTYSYAGEGTQYPYFATSAERIKRLSNGAGNASYWWERSPFRSYSDRFCYVGTSGSANYDGANNSCGVCFGFCI